MSFRDHGRILKSTQYIALTTEELDEIDFVELVWSERWQTLKASVRTNDGCAIICGWDANARLQHPGTKVPKRLLSRLSEYDNTYVLSDRPPTQTTKKEEE